MIAMFIVSLWEKIIIVYANTFGSMYRTVSFRKLMSFFDFSMGLHFLSLKLISQEKKIKSNILVQSWSSGILRKKINIQSLKK